MRVLIQKQAIKKTWKNNVAQFESFPVELEHSDNKWWVT